MALYLTYDDQSMQDGLGAQALRITGIYSLAKQFRLRYLHTPISHVIEDIGHNLDGGTSLKTIIDQMNDFFSFPSDNFKRKRVKHIFVRELSRKKLVQLWLKGTLFRGSLVVHILLPMGVLDKFPAAYKHASKFLRDKNKRTLEANAEIQLLAHVRRGYDEKYANLRYASGRHLPFSYFSDAISAACIKFNIPKSSKLHLHTDLVNQAKTWKPSQINILEGFRENGGDQVASGIELEAYDLMKLVDCPSGYALEIHYCDPLMETFIDMCTARVLIQGKSALSYLAGIVNSNIVVFPTNQAHSKLPGWHTSESLQIEIKDPMLG